MMTNGLHIARDRDEFAKYSSVVTAAVDPTKRLPDWPFTAHDGAILIGQFGHLLGPNFAPVLDSLARAHGDESITLAVLSPEPSYYETNFSYFTAIQMESSAIADSYAEGVYHEPMGKATGCIVFTADVVGIVGSSGTWAVWGQRDWDLVVVRTPSPSTTTIGSTVPFVSAAEALEDFTFPDWRGEPPPADQVATFMRNFASRA